VHATWEWRQRRLSRWLILLPGCLSWAWRHAQVPVPEDAAAAAAAKRAELVERVAEVDEELGELFLAEADVDAATLRRARRLPRALHALGEPAPRPGSCCCSTAPSKLGVVCGRMRVQGAHQWPAGWALRDSPPRSDARLRRPPPMRPCRGRRVSGAPPPCAPAEAGARAARRAAVRRATLALTFVPLFMGSAYKNRGVQLLLDGVREFLPCPIDVNNTALVR